MMAAAGLDDRTLRERVGQRWFALVVMALPLSLMLGLAWTQRWMSDDGFINVRVVQQIFDGNGPVFNAGERVEVTTSPLWVLCLVTGKIALFWLPLEWVAVLLGLALTITAGALAIVSSWRVHHTWRLLPIGILMYVVLPPAAVHATAGLELGLTLLWIAGWYLLLHAADQPDGRAVLATAFVIGLGPLIRPDLAVMSLLAGAVLMVRHWPRSPRRLAVIATSALAVPLTYELFRMSYYGNLLPNPAYAKEATASNWAQGWEYLKDFNGPYWVWVSMLVLVGAALVSWKHVPRGRRLVLAAPPAAGLVYAILVIRGGGDFMHARMLLPAVFAIQLPVAAVPLRRSTLLLLGATVLWAVVPLAAGGPPYLGIGPHGITNERGLYAAKLGNPVTVEDYASTGLVMLGRTARARSQSGHKWVDVFLPGVGTISQPLDPRAPAFARHGVLSIGAIGMATVAAGNKIYIADQLGLASPIGARLEITNRIRPGHEKYVRPSWTFAMFGDPQAPPPEHVSAAALSDARQALSCPPIEQMLQRARAPLTLHQIGLNAVQSFTEFSTRIDPDPTTQLARCRQ
jgi:arabinofuranosyltransferase